MQKTTIKNIDVSIFEDVRNDVMELLRKYTEKGKEDSRYETVEEAELFVVNRSCMEELMVCSERLIMEYQYLGDDIFKRFDISNIVKIINPQHPAHWYKTFVDESWKQVNDTELVRERLDKELAKYKAILMSNTRKKIKEKSIPDEKAKDIYKRIKEKEFPEAEKLCEFIKENFDELDVRISTYHERTKYGAIQFMVSDSKKMVNLRKKVPNVLWFEKIEARIRKNNELILYLSKAKRAFGDVYFVPKKEYKRDPKTIRGKKRKPSKENNNAKQ